MLRGIALALGAWAMLLLVRLTGAHEVVQQMEVLAPAIAPSPQRLRFESRPRVYSRAGRCPGFVPLQRGSAILTDLSRTRHLGGTLSVLGEV